VQGAANAILAAAGNPVLPELCATASHEALKTGPSLQHWLTVHGAAPATDLTIPYRCQPGILTISQAMEIQSTISRGPIKPSSTSSRAIRRHSPPSYR
jgi:hypothetical protein